MKNTAVITGISRGIGLAIAEKFHAEGFEILGCARNPERLKSLKNKYPAWKLLRSDFGKPEDVETFAEFVLKNASDTLAVLINNVGIFTPGGLLTEEKNALEKLMQVNFFSAYNLTKKLLPVFTEKRKGSIVNIGSIAGLQPYPSSSSYCVTKFAMTGFTKVLREELKPYGVRVIGIYPGAVYTDSWKGSGLPPERFMMPEDIAEAVFLSCSLPQRTVIEDIVLRPLEGDI